METALRPADPVEFAEEYSLNPGEALRLLEDPEALQNPYYYGRLWAAAQHEYVSGKTRGRELTQHQPSVRRFLRQSGEWNRILASTADGQPQPHELQLVLWSAQQADKKIQTNRPGMGGTILRKIASIDMPMFDEIPTRDVEAWDALQDFVRHNPRYRKHLNPPSPHLLVVGQVELIRSLGLVDSLDVANPNPLVLGMIKQLEGFIQMSGEDVGRDGGESLKDLPEAARNQANALSQYAEDCIIYESGRTTVAQAVGRPWHFLGETGRAKFREFNEIRGDMKEHANRQFYRAFIQTPPQINERLWDLSRQYVRASRTDNTEIKMRINEMTGAVWAAIALRQGEIALRPVINRHYHWVQIALEPYVLDGLNLVASGKAAKWLDIVALESWCDIDDKISVSTPAFGSESDDREQIGQAFSRRISKYYRQKKNNPEGTSSLGYKPTLPHVGITNAYIQMMDAAAVPTPKGMVLALRDRFLSTVNYYDKRTISLIASGLPREVKEVVEKPELLKDRILAERSRYGR